MAPHPFVAFVADIEADVRIGALHYDLLVVDPGTLGVHAAADVRDGLNAPLAGDGIGVLTRPDEELSVDSAEVPHPVANRTDRLVGEKIGGAAAKQTTIGSEVVESVVGDGIADIAEFLGGDRQRPKRTSGIDHRNALGHGEPDIALQVFVDIFDRSARKSVFIGQLP